MTLSLISFISSNSEATEIDIMIVYDRSAKAWVDRNGGISAFGQDAINRMNQVMQNSNINLTFRLVHSMTLDITETDLENTLSSLQAGSGIYAYVHSQRNKYKADLVTMFVDIDLATARFTGYGNLLTSWSGSPNYAFSVCAIQSVAIHHVLTHEIGHNLGAHHSKFQADYPGPNIYFTNPTAPYSAGWYFIGNNGTKYNTIMAYPNDGYGNLYTTAPIFSSPLINYQGTVAGHTQDGDNARLIRETKDIVSAYRQSATASYDLSVSKSGTGNGTVTSSPTGINCGSLCTATFTSDTNVTLTAQVEAGSIFYGWSGACSGTSTTCNVSMNGNKNVEAIFNIDPCNYSIDPASASFESNGGFWQVSVTTAMNNCTWTAVSNVSWITITNGSVGTGNGTVTYAVAQNKSQNPRTGTITIAGQTHTVTQAGGGSSCDISISPLNAKFTKDSGTGAFEVTTTSSLMKQSNIKDEVLISQYDTNASTDKYSEKDRLIQKVERNGSIRVIVKLKERFMPEGLLANDSQINSQRDSISMIQNKVISSLKDYKIEGLKRYTFIPYMALKTDLKGLTAIYENPNIDEIFEDKVGRPSLADSVPLIQGNQAWNAGFTGAGWTVAILDTGVQNNHPFLSGKVVSEACYSTTDANYNSESLCPNGQGEDLDMGAGDNCDTSIQYCGHGTHVAGIVSGVGSSFSGVAKGSNLISIQIHSKFTGSFCTDYGVSSPCTGYYNSDIVKALERVNYLSNTYQIASVNLSIGSMKQTSICDGAQSAIKSAIDNLRSKGIATIIASGNNGYTDGILEPSCISTAISVGATTKSDAISSFSNSASFLSLLAPGSSINSSLPTDRYDAWNGTSMAAAHVSGAWAILKQAKPNASVTDIYQALADTGKPILDNKNNITKPRINIKSALDSLTGACTWTATSNDNWITINSGSSGTGSGTVTYSVSSNSGTYRTGTITVGNKIHTVTQSDTAFADVNSSMWSKNYIIAIFNNGITVGCIQSPIRYYCPSNKVTRGEMAAFIIRAKYGGNFTYPTTPYFTDVPASHDFFKYVQRLKYDGITTQTGIYRVNDPVTRGEMAAFIIRARYGDDNFTWQTTPYFSDVPTSNTFFKYVQRLRQDNITTQTGIYRVNDEVSREEMAAFLSRAFLGMQ